MNSLGNVSEAEGIVPFFLSPLRIVPQVCSVWNSFLEIKRNSLVLPSILLCSGLSGKGGLFASIAQLSAAFYILSELWSHQKSVSEWERERKGLLSSVEQSSEELRKLKEEFEEMRKREKALSLGREQYEQHLKDLDEKIKAKVTYYRSVCSLIQRLENGDSLSPEEEKKVEEAQRMRREKSDKRREEKLSSMDSERQKKNVRDLLFRSSRSSVGGKSEEITFGTDRERVIEDSGRITRLTTSNRELSWFRKLALGFITLVENSGNA